VLLILREIDHKQADYCSGNALDVYARHGKFDSRPRLRLAWQIPTQFVSGSPGKTHDSTPIRQNRFLSNMSTLSHIIFDADMLG